MTPEELQDLCALYALGVLDPQEAAVVEVHLRAGDAEVLRTVMAFRGVVEQLPHGLPQHPPAPEVRERLMARLHATTHVTRDVRAPARRPRTAWFRTPWLWAPAAAVLVAVQGWLVASSLRHVDHVADTSHAILARAREHEWYLNDFKMVALMGTEHAPKAGAMVFWDTRRNVGTLLIHDLPPLAPHEAYQVWFLAGGNAIGAASFSPAGSGPTMLQVPLPPGKANLESAAVTVEPAGGVPQPTGKTVLHGTF